MNLLRARRLAAWIALVAMALAVLAPTVSRALGWGQAAPGLWTEVCTVAGPQWMRLDTATAEAPAVPGASGGDPPAPANPLDPCPWCLLGADRLGPPGVPPVAFRLHGDPVAPACHPAVFFHSLAPLAAHARGPPLHTAPLSVA